MAIHTVTFESRAAATRLYQFLQRHVGAAGVEISDHVVHFNHRAFAVLRQCTGDSDFWIDDDDVNPVLHANGEFRPVRTAG